jgi:sigma-E factor negative regulatory protein RseA
VTQEQVESQLSAMFDGELPAAECELLSRRIDRDENLRARWSRYALIGAAMRSEPVATARRGFAAKVSAGLDASDRARLQRSRPLVRRRALWNTALAASMVTAVAGVSIGMLRYSAPSATSGVLTRAVVRAAPLTVATPALATVSSDAPGLLPVDIRTALPNNGEPRNYVTPLNQTTVDRGLRTELADFIVAHSEYSTPLMRRNLLSALVSSEDASEPSAVVGNASAGQGNAAPASGSIGR